MRIETAKIQITEKMDMFLNLYRLSDMILLLEKEFHESGFNRIILAEEAANLRRYANGYLASEFSSQVMKQEKIQIVKK